MGKFIEIEKISYIIEIKVVESLDEFLGVRFEIGYKNLC